MVQYGSIEYWNNRYESEEDSPFDWLVDYNEVKKLLTQLLSANKTLPILLPGCGNALFSPDLYFQGGYCDLLNIDLSPVVIDQMSRKYKDEISKIVIDSETKELKQVGMKWKVMDVLHLQLENESFPYIIDKSLIDTLMCYPDGSVNTMKMIYELYRILTPNGRLITFSLHSPEEVAPYFHNQISKKYSEEELPRMVMNWRVSIFRIKSSRWNDTINRRRAVACTMIVCDKQEKDKADYSLLELDDTLSEEEYQKLEEKSKEVNLRVALRIATIDEVIGCLDVALRMHIDFLKDLPITEQIHLETT